MTKQQAIEKIKKIANTSRIEIKNFCVIVGDIDKEDFELSFFQHQVCAWAPNIDAKDAEKMIYEINSLIPILFNNDVDNSILTKQSKTIKEGE